MNSSRAGQVASPEDLVDVAHLVTAYYTGDPDPAETIFTVEASGAARHTRT